MKHEISVLGCGVIYIDNERVFGSKPYGLFSTVNWSATDEDLKRIADRCLELAADRKTEPQMGDAKPIPLSNRVTHIKDEPQTERIKTLDYCDICNHKGCDKCIANNLDDYCVPSGYEPITQTETQNSNLTFEKRTMRDCYNCKRYETEGECIECHYEPKDEPQTDMAEDIVRSYGFNAESYRQAKAKTEPQTERSE